MFDRLLIMGILNVTPDSFYDGGKWFRDPVGHAAAMIQDGADIIDIGGESSGPDSQDVALEEELRRVVPVVSAIRKKYPNILISVDTYKSEVARQALLAGANMINDVTALRGDPKMADTVTRAGAWLIMMYSKDPSARTTRDVVHFDDVVATIKDFFRQRDFAYDKIILDPGMGFFVSGEPKYSFEILDRLEEFRSLGRPIMLGPSNKSFLGGSLKDRLQGTIDCCAKAVMKGVNILRVHDVKAVRQSLSARSQRPTN